jgi:unsaturated rhamnogalacturonyl hydrolase
MGLAGILLAVAGVVGLTLGQATLPSVDPTLGRGKVIGEDYFYNHQVRNGQQFHYIWDDAAISGYSKFGDLWKQYGATITKVDKAPTRADLDKLSVYIIVNPSTPKNAADGKPNYMQAADADVIESWVKDGGVLLLFSNDKNNTEFEHFNILVSRFGMSFNGDLRNEVPTVADRARGSFNVAELAPNEPLFENVKMIYMKEISTITVKPPAKAILVADNEQHTGKDNIIATAKVGKGFVFAVGDPWFYNEYIDVTSPGLPLENRKTAMNLIRWILPMSKAVAK